MIEALRKAVEAEARSLLMYEALNDSSRFEKRC